MPWRYHHDQAEQLVEVLYTGNVTGHDLRDSTTACISLEKQAGVDRFLIDASDLHLDASLAEIYDLPAKQYTEEQADRHARVALVLPGTAKERAAVLFYETACVNRGWDVKTFQKRQQAVAWLLAKPPADKFEQGGQSSNT